MKRVWSCSNPVAVVPQAYAERRRSQNVCLVGPAVMVSCCRRAAATEQHGAVTAPSAVEEAFPLLHRRGSQCRLAPSPVTAPSAVEEASEGEEPSRAELRWACLARTLQRIIARRRLWAALGTWLQSFSGLKDPTAQGLKDRRA